MIAKKTKSTMPRFLLFVVCLLRHTCHVKSQRPQTQRPQLQTCTGPVLRFPPPSKGQCLESWVDQGGQEKLYPEDFDDILNRAQIFQCPSRGKRVIISNGIPNHSVILQNRVGPCEINWVVEVPLNPSMSTNNERTEIPIRGMIAMALNGVPAYGPQENDYLNAVEGTMGVQGARFWYGHAGPNSAWHVHNPKMGMEIESHETLLGYAMDGFPIYGHIDDDSVLDPCNGMFNKDGKYQYHVRTLDQVDDSLEYCNSNSPETNWNYVLGCYSGSVDDTQIFDSTSYLLDDDCFLDDTGSDATVLGSANQAAEISSQITASQGLENDDNVMPKRPNIIIMQPDDLPFYDAWGPPPNNPSTLNRRTNLPNFGLPHIESLRLNGLQMMQAYSTSAMCGTSRFSTLTSRYPSRSLSNEDGDPPPNNVIIPTSKLEGDDCIKNNLAAQFQDNGYRTAMIGKWHLSYIQKATYTYDSAVNTIKECGYDTVDGLYIENLVDGDNLNSFSDGSFSHNMEWITHEAIKVIKEDSDKPFFMYFNPTVPHSSNSITSALREFSCRDTPSGTLTEDPIIPGMTDGGDCKSYRESIFERSGGDEDDLGAIWLDDSVGALLKSLEDMGALKNTIFLFQADHGIDPKKSLYEGGIRIPQFIHYPAVIRAGDQFESPVSVIDTGATLLDFAEIRPSYEIDGLSWKDAVSGESSRANNWEDRCLYFEVERDRSLRCGCLKYLSIYEENEDSSTTYKRGAQKGLSNDELNLFDLCGGSEKYVTKIKGSNMEVLNLIYDDPNLASDFATLLDCHLERIEAKDFSRCQHSLSEPDMNQILTVNPTSSSMLSEGPTRKYSEEPTSNPTDMQLSNKPTKSPALVPNSSELGESPLDLPSSRPTKKPTYTSPSLSPLKNHMSGPSLSSNVPTQDAIPDSEISASPFIKASNVPTRQPNAASALPSEFPQNVLAPSTSTPMISGVNKDSTSTTATPLSDKDGISTETQGTSLPDNFFQATNNAPSAYPTISQIADKGLTNTPTGTHAKEPDISPTINTSKATARSLWKLSIFFSTLCMTAAMNNVFFI